MSGNRLILPVPLLVVIVLGLAAGGFGILSLGGERRPVATWHFGPDASARQPFAAVPARDPMSLTVDLPWPGCVYVVGFDHRRGTVCYFPSEFLGTDHKNPETGQMHHFDAGRQVLPGTWTGEEINWTVPEIKESLSLCVVVSRTPLAELEAILRRTQQMGNTAFPDKSMGLYMPRAGRDKLVGQTKLPDEMLQAAQDQMDSVTAGPMAPLAGRPDVFLKVMNILPGRPRAGVKKPGDPLRNKLRQLVDDKLREDRRPESRDK